MSLTLNATEARQADRTNQAIKTSGKYIGKITRAEKLLSKNNTEGLGISFVTDDGATANYLDLYTINNKGVTLPSMATVQAILCCTRTKNADEGPITFDKWDKDAQEVIKATANGYPALMGKRIGFLLQQELSTNSTNGNDVDRVVIVGVFEADTELTASEILDQATKPEKLSKMVESLMARPIYDRRDKPVSSGYQQQPKNNDESDDFPF